MKIGFCNIERDNHLGEVELFLKKHNFDIFCAVEVMEKDLQKIKLAGNFLSTYHSAISIAEATPDGSPQGIAVFSKLPFPSTPEIRLLGDFNNPDVIPQAKFRDPHTVNWKLLKVTFEQFDLFCTHAPVTHKGSETSDYQRLWRDRLITELDQSGNFILCGDINAPRGYEIWDSLAEKYVDNIPKKYTTSIDNNLHRSGYKDLQYVIDCLFTKNTSVNNVSYHEGISDHFGLSFDTE